MEKILLRNIGIADSHTLAIYRSRGGYASWQKVAGGMPKDSPKPKYLVCNADESEPGTFKDRLLIEDDPHAIIEGTLIAAFAIQSHTAFIYVRGELAFGAGRLERAVDEAYRAGYLG